MSLLLKNNIKLLVCDMAGTIINEKNIVYNSLAMALEKIGCPTNKIQQESWPGRDKREILKEFIELNNDNYDVLQHAATLHEAETIFMEELESQYFQQNNISLIDKDNLTCLFDRLRINGVKVALNTGYPKSLQEKLIKHFNLYDKIDDYISSNSVNMGRPYPYMIHRLVERNNIKDMKTVAKIGDTINDMHEGKNAGCGLTIGVLTGKTTRNELIKHGDIVVDKITDLL